MAVKAIGSITLAVVKEVVNTYPLFKLQKSTLNPPSVPSGAASGWSMTEPTYNGNSTETLYIAWRIVYSDASVSYTAVSKSTAYEAAKAAWNKAHAAQTGLSNLNNYFWKDSTGSYISEYPKSSGLVGFMNRITSAGMELLLNGAKIAEFGGDVVRLGIANAERAIITLCADKFSFYHNNQYKMSIINTKTDQLALLSGEFDKPITANMGVYMGLIRNGDQGIGIVGTANGRTKARLSADEWEVQGLPAQPLQTFVQASGTVDKSNGAGVNAPYYWRWVKYQDGFAECWGWTLARGVTWSSAWGNLYETSEQWGPTLPFAFVAAPEATVTAMTERGGSICGVELAGRPSASKMPNYYLLRPNEYTTPSNIRLSMHIWGRWR